MPFFNFLTRSAACTLLVSLTLQVQSTPFAQGPQGSPSSSWPGRPSSSWQHPPSGSPEAGAIYFLRVDPAGSSIVAIGVDEDGMLTNHSSVTSTGGVGLQSMNATSGTQVKIDPLQGQDAVCVGDDYLFTINSGSDTATMFRIDSQNPLQLNMVGSPVPTLGSFAMSITYSSKWKTACVLNGGSTNGVACYTVSPAQGLIPDGKGLRASNYDFVTPPVLGGPKGSGSDIQFSADQSHVIAVLKGDTTPATLGHIQVFDVSSNGAISSTSWDADKTPLAGPFGFAIDPTEPSTLFVTDVAFGGALISLDYAAQTSSIISIVNDTAAFAASCWAFYSADTNSFYNVDAGSTKFGKVSPTTGQLEALLSYETTLGGGLDTVAWGSKAYFLSAVNEIGVFDLETGKMVQTLAYSSASDRPYWTGMAKYSYGGGSSGW